MPETVLLDTDDGVATLTINRPERRNALSAEVQRDLLRLLHQCASDDQVRVIVLTGAGDRAFSAGGDLKNMSERPSTAEHFLQRKSFVDLLQTMHQIGKPIIARLNGDALAGGCGLALNCDFAIAADHARIGTPEVNVGLFPMMIMAVISRNVPRKRAAEMVFTGRIWSAQEACDLHMINEVVPAAELDAAVRRWTDRLKQISPLAIKLGRDAVYHMSDLPMEKQLPYLQSMLSILFSSDDAREGIQAFVEKRQPVWRGK